MMGTLLQDLRYGIRMLRNSPGFAAVAILTLALGIGANSAIFTVVNAVLLQPLPYSEPDRLVYLNEGNSGSSIGYPNYVDWAAQNHVFESIGAMQGVSFVLTGHGNPELIPGNYISEGFFPALRAKPIMGRGLTPDDDQPTATPVALVSYKFWQQRLGGDPNVLNTVVQLDERAYSVIGVMPRDFQFPLADEPELFVPIGLVANTREKQDRAKHEGTSAIARLKPGVTIQQAQADFDLISARLAKAYPDVDYEKQALLQPLYDVTVYGVKDWLLVLLAAVGLVLLIACANVANLLLARATARQSEMAIRLSLGAPRARLFRQMLTESTLLGVLGGTLGLLLASGGVKALLAFAPETLIRVQEIHLNAHIVGFTFLVSVLTGVGFGLVPAWHIARFRGALQGEAQKTNTGRHLVKNILVVAELSLSLVLLVGAGLLVQSFVRFIRQDTGFDHHNLITAGIHLPLNKYKTQPELDAFFDGLVEKLNATPGIESSAVSVPLEFTGTSWGYGFLVEGEPFPAPNEINYTRLHYITPEYLSTFKIPLVRGRNFTHSDNDSNMPVALVSKSFVHRWLHDEDAIGKRVRLGKARDLASAQNPWFTIVGVIHDVSHDAERWLGNEELLVPFDQHQRYHVPMTGRSIVMRARGDSALAVQQLRSIVASMDQNLPVDRVATMDQLISGSMVSQRTLMFLITTFAAVALLLAAIGIYGVLSFWVNQRTREIGIRLALGANQKNILSVVLREGIKLILFGLAIGLPLALGLTNLLPNILYGVGRHDPITFIVIAGLLGFVAILACYMPARRAAKVDPMVALRYE
jgi:putative ABC transport system permease protein